MGYRVDHSIMIIGLDGQPMKHKVGEELRDTTLGDVVAQALFADIEPKASEEDKYRRFELAMRFAEAKPKEKVVIDSSELGRIVKRIGDTQSTYVYGKCKRVFDKLKAEGEDPDDNSEDAKAKK